MDGKPGRVGRCVRGLDWQPAVLVPPRSIKCWILCVWSQRPLTRLFTLFTRSVHVQHLYLLSEGDPRAGR